jgi:CRP-like cAMP-binding protein
METSVSHKTGNLLLNSLSQPDRMLITGALEPVELKVHQRLELPNRPAQYVYFPDSGMASIVVKGRNGADVEGGMVGREGVVGLGASLGVDRPVHETMIQMSGRGQRMTAEAFTKGCRSSEAFDLTCRRFCHAFMVQVSYTALANARNNLEQRLARWILMAEDRADGPDVNLTHDFLALMLGVRRAGVTLAIQLLTRNGLISHSRGRIVIQDRDGLIAETRGSYGPPEAHWKRLFGSG